MMTIDDMQKALFNLLVKLHQSPLIKNSNMTIQGFDEKFIKPVTLVGMSSNKRITGVLISPRYDGQYCIAPVMNNCAPPYSRGFKLADTPSKVISELVKLRNYM